MSDATRSSVGQWGQMDGSSCLKRRVNPSKKARGSFHMDGGGFGGGSISLPSGALVVVRALVRFIYIT